MTSTQLNELYSSVRSLCIEEIKRHGSIKLFELSEDGENGDEMYDLPQSSITNKYCQVTHYALTNIIIDEDTIHIEGISLEDDADTYTFYIEDISTSQMLYLLEYVEQHKLQTA
jgi:hypothetical protein